MNSQQLRRFIENTVAAAVNRVERRLGNMIATAVIEGVSGGKFQKLKGTSFDGDTDDDIVLFEQGGVVHIPLPGAEGITLAIGARAANRAAIGVSNRAARPTGLAPGETGIYTAGDNAGLRILAKADGSVEITPGDATPKVIIKGELEVEREVSAMTATPATKVTLSKHMTPSPFGPLGPPQSGT